ncbi:MAG: hypothetical protein ACXAC2_00455 [Candidatus Kariarchaeaceae archaeon]|jgi:hypothetical protein
MKREDLKEIWMPVWNITGKMERNYGRIIIETGCSRAFLTAFFEALYGEDYPENTEMPLGEWEVKLRKKE